MRHPILVYHFKLKGNWRDRLSIDLLDYLRCQDSEILSKKIYWTDMLAIALLARIARKVFHLKAVAADVYTSCECFTKTSSSLSIRSSNTEINLFWKLGAHYQILTILCIWSRWLVVANSNFSSTFETMWRRLVWQWVQHLPWLNYWTTDIERVHLLL